MAAAGSNDITDWPELESKSRWPRMVTSSVSWRTAGVPRASADRPSDKNVRGSRYKQIMTTEPLIINHAEGLVQQLAAELTRVHDRECLCCYIARQLLEFPCDGTHRHAFRFQSSSAPRATALKERLDRYGACCCDCELFLNGFEPHRRFWTPEREVDDRGATLIINAEPPEHPPPCAGVRRGSVRPCDNWVRLRRW